jgi:hypothetical protein
VPLFAKRELPSVSMPEIVDEDYRAGRADHARGTTNLLARIAAAAVSDDLKLEDAAISYALGMADAIREERRRQRDALL